MNHEHRMSRFHVFPSMALMLASVFVLDGCQAVAGIFKAGVWVGVLVVVGLMALGGLVAALAKR